jgi:hypothetical protein
MAKTSVTLTERDRYWLGHHEACEKSGLSAKAYARKHRLSIHGLYQARKRLRGLGALAAAGSRPSRTKPKAGASRGFARVEVAAVPKPRYRVRLSNGALVEWEGAPGADLAEVLGTVSQLG